MTRTRLVVGLILLYAALLLGGCGNHDTAGKVADTATGNGTPADCPSKECPPAAANRGTFGTVACGPTERKAVPGTAVLAVYYDENGAELGSDAELLTGTENNTMCPAAKLTIPGGCPNGTCPYNGGGNKYCGPCRP
jgi:hypothetical protein